MSNIYSLPTDSLSLIFSILSSMGVKEKKGSMSYVDTFGSCCQFLFRQRDSWYKQQLSPSTATFFFFEDSIPSTISSRESYVRQWLLARARDYRRWNTAVLAVEQGELSILKWLVAHNVPIRSDVLCQAALTNRVDIIDWCLEYGGRLSTQVVNAAARAGHIPLVDYLISKGCPYTNTLLIEAATAGCLSTIQSWYQKLGSVGSRLFNTAIAAGHLNIVLWLESVGKGQKVDSATIDLIIERDHRPLITWLLGKKYTIDWSHYSVALANGHRELATLLKDYINTDYFQANRLRHRQIVDVDISRTAAYRGDIMLLEELLERFTHGYMAPDTTDHKGKLDAASAFKGAVEGGQVAVLEWLSSHGFEIEVEGLISSCFNTAVLNRRDPNNHYDWMSIYQWLIDHGASFPLDYNLYGYVECGDLEQVQWLIDMGCSWHDNLYKAAALTGQLEIIQWAASHFSPPLNPEVLEVAAMAGHLNVIQWCLKAGVPYTKSVSKAAAEYGYGFILEWLARGLHPISNEVLKLACAGGYWEIANWALNIEHMNRRNLTKGAAQNGHIHILEWLLNNDLLLDYPTYCPTGGDYIVELCLNEQSIALYAIASGHLHVLTWMEENGLSMPDEKAMMLCSSTHNQIHILKWLVDRE